MRSLFLTLLVILGAAYMRFTAGLRSPGPSGVHAVYIKSPLGGGVCAAYSVLSGRAGGLLLAGIASGKDGTFHSCLWSVGADGRLVTAFGAGGVVCSRGEEWAWAATAGPGGRTYLAGMSGKDWKRSPAAFVRCYTAAGETCPGFGSAGVARLKPPPGYRFAAAAAVTVYSSSVFAAGDVTSEDGAVRPAVWELDLSGRPASSLLPGGFEIPAVVSGARDSRINALLALPGRLMAGGNFDWRRTALWEFSSGRGAARLLTGPSGVVRALLTAPDGGVFAAGFRYGALPGEKAETGLLFKVGDGEPVALGSMENQEVFSLSRLGGDIYAAGYADEDGKVKAAVWRADGEGRPRKDFSRVGVLVIGDGLGGGESRIYSLSALPGRIAAAGYSKYPDGEMALAVWDLRP